MLALLGLLLAAAHAQTPDDRWRTVETEQFRVHYPVQAEAWALEAASQLDDVRRRVVGEVGFAPEQKVDVVIVDPYTAANGSAWPFLGSPRLLLWATPPDADSVIGHYRSWTELLVTHEDAHLVHLLRPSRNPVMHGVDVFAGIGPIARKAPRWVIEGYATVLEARLTGYGRPRSDFRALLLRELGREGRMPTYGELNGTPRYLGGAFAYLVGSAYLEWLEARGPGTLVDVWARLSAREERKFDEAFAGVFGDDPAALYARFVAEITHAAIEIEQARPVDEGTKWMDLSWATGAPAVSPDGEKLAAVVRQRDQPDRLVVWATAVDEEALARREEAVDELLAEDPEDVPPIEPETEPHEVLHTRIHHTREPVLPRWMPDGDAILFSAWRFDGDGRYRPDLWLWYPETGEERRVTRLADVRAADPSPDGTFAVAIQHDWGRTRVVRVDLADGAVRPLTEFDIDVVYDEPRLSPDGSRIAWLEHRGEGWDVVVRRLDGDVITRVRRGGPDGPTYANLAWSPDGQRLYASVGEDGFVEIREVLDREGPADQVTRTRGGAWAPAPTPDGEALFFLSLDAEGFDIHRVSLDALEPDVAVDGPPPVVRPEPERVSRPERVAVAPEPYGLGRTELRPLIGGAWSDSQAAIEVGLRAGDLVGRHDLLLMGSWGGDAGVTGALLAATWRRLPVDPIVEAFVASEGAELMERAGATLRLERAFVGQDASAAVVAGGWLDRPLDETIRDDDSGLLDDDLIPDDVVVRVAPGREVAWAAAAVAAREPRRNQIGGGLSGLGQLGRTGDDGWWRAEGTANLWFGRGPRLRIAYTYGVSDTEWGIDRYRLGGVPSSVLPDAWRQRVTPPGFEVGLLRGQDRDALRVAYESGLPLTVFAERHRMGDDGLPDHGATLIGLDARFELPAQSFAKLPALDAGGGLGCLIERPVGGWDDDPCNDIEEDWSLWLYVNWEL